MRTGKAPDGPISTRISWLDSGATTSVARTISVRGDKEYTDYLLLARLAQGWRIVGKLCQDRARPDPGADEGV
ncbi:nuclear transport factor 2 family protein, partial [Escherichia coli]